jgi:hypothetical protein
MMVIARRFVAARRPFSADIVSTGAAGSGIQLRTRSAQTTTDGDRTDLRAWPTYISGGRAYSKKLAEVERLSVSSDRR